MSKTRKRLLTMVATVAALVAVSVPAFVAFAPESKAAEPECKVYGPLTITWVDNGHAGFCGRVVFTGPQSYTLKVSLKDAVRDGRDARMQLQFRMTQPSGFFLYTYTTYTNGTVGTWRTFEASRPARREDPGCFRAVWVTMSNSGHGTVERQFYNPYC